MKFLLLSSFSSLFNITKQELFCKGSSFNYNNICVEIAHVEQQEAKHPGISGR